MGVTPSGADPAVAEWPIWPYQAVCYGPPFDPVNVFSGAATAELGSLPSEVALRDVLHDPALAWLGLRQAHWRFVSEGDTQAVFVNGDLSSAFQQWILLERSAEGWKLAGNGSCAPRSILHGLVAVPWTVAVDQQALGKNTRRIRIDLAPGGCSGGMGQNERARKPIFRRIGRRLLMTMLVDPLPPGAYTCQGVVEPPLEVRLPGRLGKRKLYDGGTYPPGDVVSRWREKAGQRAVTRSSRLRQ
jgi:hypothetical protein